MFRAFYLPMKKFLRTTISTIDGIEPARINMDTGEVKPYPYKIESLPRPKGTMPDDYSKPLFWELIPAPNYSVSVSRETKSRKSKQNANNVFLKEFDTLEDARQALGMLDNLLTGVSHLHRGKRPTCKGLLFRLLRDLDDINAQSIAAYTGYSEKYSADLALYLRVLSLAFDNEIER